MYNAALLALGAGVLPLALVGLVLRRDWRQGLAERLGRITPTARGRAAVWIHGASVGEITALAPIARMVREEFPDYRLVVSTVTLGGRTAAQLRIPEADDTIVFPLDLSWVVARALDAVAPRLVLFSETELWPNFLAAVAARGIPAMMVSGRVSARAHARYRRWRWLFAPTLGHVRVLAVQSLDTARRLRALGAPAGRIVVTGSLKRGTPATTPAALTLATLGVADVPVVVGASTHAGEEAALLDAWPALLAVAPTVRLVLAPRRPERWDEVAALITGRGLRFRRRSALGAGGRWDAGDPILLLDTLGELTGLYPDARVAFVGGTLVPVGGHNVLEPAAAAVPVVFGPHLEHIADAAHRLTEAGGGWRVADATQLAAVLARLVGDAVGARAAGRRARAVASDAGPLAVTLALVRGALRTWPAAEATARVSGAVRASGS